MLRKQAHGDANGQMIAVKDAVASQHERWHAMLYAQATPVYRWIYLHVGSREQAEALTMRVFDQAARGNVPEVPTSEAARERLLLIARGVVADDLSAFYGAAAGPALARVLRLSLEDVETMSDESSRANLPAVRTQSILAHLPAREREVLTCRFLLGYPIERTATQLHLSVTETMALQFVALTHASQFDALPAEGENETEAEGSDRAPRAVEPCCCGS